MRVTLLTVVVALTFGTYPSDAADPECIYRELRNMPMHWSNPADCGRFYRCTNKNVKREVVCAADKEYNPKTGKCASTGKGYCKLSLVAPLAGDDNACADQISGTSIANVDNCRDFYICNDNMAYPQNCDPGSYFNATSCIPDTDSQCWQNYCLNEADGVSLADTTSCLQFYVCSATNAVLQTCGSGSFFNTSASNCQPDVNNANCWENFCLTAADGTFVKNPDNCHAFYVCKAQQAVPQNCSEGSYFDWTSNNCQPGECPSDETTPEDCEGTTPTPAPEPCTCPGGYLEGQFLPYPGNCMYFYICSGGVLVQSSCQTGNYFDNSTLSCQLDTDNVCPQCASNYRRAKRSLVGDGDSEDGEAVSPFHELRPQVKARQQHSCLGRYTEGETIPISNACWEFQICILGKMHTYSCESDQYFDANVGDCVHDAQGICEHPRVLANSCPGDYAEGEVVASPTGCWEYKICILGELHTHICDYGFYFNSVLGACVFDELDVCYTKSEPAATSTNCNEEDQSQCTCPGNIQPNAIVANPSNCNAYYICLNGKLELNWCGEYEKFDNSSGACVPDPENECGGDIPTEPTPTPPAGICTNQPNGQLVPNEEDCEAYYQCTNGVPTPGTCDEGYYFSPQTASCEPDVYGYCINPCKDTTGIVLLPYPANCTKYYLCNNGSWHIGECIVGGFDEELGACSLNSTCEISMCQNQPDGMTFPVGVNITTEFYYCLNGLAILRNCTPNTQYNPNLGICMMTPSVNCNQTICENATEIMINAFPTLDNAESAFCFCRNGAAFEDFCPTDYVFNADIGVCYSNAPCDPELCTTSPDYTVSINRNDTQSFCMCVTHVAVIVDCPNNGTFNAKLGICRPPATQDPNCYPTYCLDMPDYATGSARNTSAGFCLCVGGSSTYHACMPNSTYVPTLGICFEGTAETSCNVTTCADGSTVTFPTYNDPYSFCYCSNTSTVELRHCPAGNKYDSNTGICLPELCDATYCSNPANNNAAFPANDFPYGYCLCNGTDAVFQACPADTMFDSTSLQCVDEVLLECNITLCQSTEFPYPYPVVATNDIYSFCYCLSNDTVQLLHCPTGKYYDQAMGICVDEGTTTPTEACETPQSSQAVSTCLGVYKEGEAIPHPTNHNVFFLCQNTKLVQKACSPKSYFDAQKKICVLEPSLMQRSRSAITQAFDNLPCLNNTKRSVPANCSQFEICIAEIWQRRSCTKQRYYNPEQQKCLEPRDDIVCDYAKLTGVPSCNNDTEQQTLPHKNPEICGQYYRCVRGKWGLKACGKYEYYSRHVRSCLATAEVNLCAARNASETVSGLTSHNELSANKCRHMTVRSYAGNCVMYLMCMDGEWWHQYCPLNMYFNATLNYCVPNDGAQCAAQLLSDVEPMPMLSLEFDVENCTRYGTLRPSMLACNKYYICVEGKWRQQTCASAGHYYNVTAEACLVDVDGICAQLETVCHDGVRREFPLNCTAYEVCTRGAWLRGNCEANWAYDGQLQQCIPNTDGHCASNGLRRACHSAEVRAWPVAENCTQFYYCEQDTWHPGACLIGHTFVAAMNTCVPHLANDSCRPIWDSETDLTILPHIVADSKEVLEVDVNLCFEYADGTAVADPDDCSRFFLCLQQRPANQLNCAVGSFFDSQLGYCRPNDGSCIVPFTGACQSASDGDTLPNLSDCLTYYKCSTLDGVQLMNCPDGQYYHNITRQCRIDHGECRKQAPERKCTKIGEHGTRLPHERYCNIYYACVRGLAIPVECPSGQQFDPVLAHCLNDDEQQCINIVELVHAIETSYSCDNLTDGTYLANLGDCTRYYICSNGNAQPKRCALNAYFDSQQLLCVPDDGSCPFVKDDSNGDGGDVEVVNQSTQPDPVLCEGKHGPMIVDPANCNEFYVCINSKLRHERCYVDYFFNTTTNQCQPYESDNNRSTTTEAPIQAPELIELSTLVVDAPKGRAVQNRCADKPTNFSNLCTLVPESGSIAEQGDCRRYISCQDNEPIQQRCRNGESYDSLLGFCRQNDGTCLLENGQRVGECNKRHGQLARDIENCRGYFVCINGQKIAAECAESEYFDKITNTCQPDVLLQCSSSPKKANTDAFAVSCKGLSDGMLYPYVQNYCRSYFQCVEGVAKLHECADGLYFDSASTRCVKEITDCAMPAAGSTSGTVAGRAPEIPVTLQKLCESATPGQPYANIDDHCRSYFICGGSHSVSYTTCPPGTLYNTEKRACAAAEHVICRI